MRFQPTRMPILCFDMLTYGLFRFGVLAVDAICNAVPLTRYTVGYDALLMRYVLSWIPDRLMDIIQTYA